MQTTTLIRIGIVTSLTGDYQKTGRGMVDSFLFVFDRRKAELKNKGYDIRIEIFDDASHAETSLTNAKQAETGGALFILGPSDTHAFFSLLQSNELEKIPLFATIATGSMLSQQGAENFFRFTTPDKVRAEILVRYVRKMYPNLAVWLYILNGPVTSYAKQLEADVVTAMERFGMSWRKIEFDYCPEPTEWPSGKDPIIVCAQSRAVVEISAALRKRSVRGQIFTFGSNSNLLKAHLKNTIVICDLDRRSAHPMVRDELDHFEVKYSTTNDPDLSTMNAATTVFNILINNVNYFYKINIFEQRKNLIKLLHEHVHNGLLGHVSFTENGEIAGPEILSLLRVEVKNGFPHFTQIDISERPRPFNSKWIYQAAITTLGLIASIVGIVQFIDWAEQKIANASANTSQSISVLPLQIDSPKQNNSTSPKDKSNLK